MNTNITFGTQYGGGLAGTLQSIESTLHGEHCANFHSSTEIAGISMPTSRLTLHYSTVPALVESEFRA